MPAKLCEFLINCYDSGAARGRIIKNIYPDDSYSCDKTKKPCVARQVRDAGSNQKWMFIDVNVQERCPSYKAQEN